jgi:hypothetical protein
MYSRLGATGATGTSEVNETLATSSGATLAITANVQVRSAPAEARVACDLTLDGATPALDHQEATVPGGSATTDGRTITLVGTETATGDGLVRLQCSAQNAAAVTFSDVRIQAIQVDALN